MRDISRTSTLFLFLVIFATSCHANKLAQLLVKRVAPFTVEVRGKTGKKEVQASGIMISPDGHILTARSVVEGAEELEIRRPNSTSYEKVVKVMVDIGSSMALIKLPYKNKLPFIHIKGFSPYNIGTTYLTVSFADSKTKKVEASIGKLGAKLDIMPLVGNSSFNGHGKVFSEMAEFSGRIPGGPVVDEKGRFLGMANFVVTPKKKAKCFLVPTRKIASFLLTLFDPRATKIYTEHNKGFTTVRAPLDKYLKEVGYNLDVKAKLAFKKEVTAEVLRTISINRQIKEAEAKKHAADKPKFMKLSKRGRKLHREHPDWPYEFVEGICNHKAIKGMTKEMVRKIHGMPYNTSASTEHGHRKETWYYQVQDYKQNSFLPPKYFRSVILFVDGKFVSRKTL